MRAFGIALLIGFTLAGAADAQFGGLINKAKKRVDDARRTTDPVTERATRAADTFKPWSAEEEQTIGGTGATKLVAMFSLVEDPSIVRYVNLVGQSVAQFSERDLPYRFAVLDADIVGAYALPGGYIFITRAALSGMTNEAQLAGALGHEIVHCAQRHLESEIRSKKTSAWANEEAKATGKTSDLASLKADAVVKDLFNTNLSRDKEDAADEQGMLLAQKAGYSPGGLLEFLDAMKEANSKPENKRMFGQLLATHPSFESRIEHLRPAAERAGQGGATLEARFRAAIPE